MNQVVADSNYTQTSFFEFERNFSEKTWLPQLKAHFPIALVLFVVYTIATFLGLRFMGKRQPFNLRYALVLWNSAFAVFSIVVSSRVIPERIHVVQNYGWEHSMCKLESYTGPIALWGACVFPLSKIVLLGDTLFVIMRKQELTVLHWWHHISTTLYTWYMTGERQVSQLLIMHSNNMCIDRD